MEKVKWDLGVLIFALPLSCFQGTTGNEMKKGVPKSSSVLSVRQLMRFEPMSAASERLKVPTIQILIRHKIALLNIDNTWISFANHLYVRFFKHECFNTICSLQALLGFTIVTWIIECVPGPPAGARPSALSSHFWLFLPPSWSRGPRTSGRASPTTSSSAWASAAPWSCSASWCPLCRTPFGGNCSNH